jgi:carboxyl-terminal processing protease
MRRLHKSIAIVSILLPGLVGGWVLHEMVPNGGAKVFADVLRYVETSAIEGLSQDEIYERAARGLVDRLGDDYADLYSPQELATFTREQLGSNYGGLGMQIEDQAGTVTVTKVFPGTPAERGGVRAGDRILMVNGQSMRGLKLEEVSGKLVGQPGTNVEVAFGRAGVTEPIRGTYTRAVVHIPAVPYAIVLDGGVGYVPLQKFNENAATDVRNVLLDLRARGAKSYVIDLRGNGGGSLNEALLISNLFLRAGQEISRVEYRKGEPDVYTARNITVLPDAPVAVLTDGYSASASEIVAGALQDHDRAFVVGTTSFGKGLVQQIWELDGGWALKLTTGKWFTPSGRSLQLERDENGVPEVAEDAPRPAFKSDAGRTVWGGGGITPDLVVKPDTVTRAEQEFSRIVGPKGQQVYVAIYDQALKVKGGVQSNFTVQQAWRDELFQRLKTAEVPITRAQYDAARPLIDRLLEQRVAGLAFGDSASFRRFVPYDAQLREAVEVLKQAPTQKEAFALIDRRNAVGSR